jgi:hypothetical protein
VKSDEFYSILESLYRETEDGIQVGSGLSPEVAPTYFEIVQANFEYLLRYKLTVKNLVIKFRDIGCDNMLDNLDASLRELIDYLTEGK